MKNKFIIGGYFLVVISERPKVKDKDLIYDKIISNSECICDIFPGWWSLKWTKLRDQHVQYYRNKFKFTPKQIDDFSEDVTNLFNEKKIGYKNVIMDIETARYLYHSHLFSIKNMKLVGIGLHIQDIEDFIELNKPYKDNFGEYGIYTLLLRESEMDMSNILGYDILGFDCGAFHSYLCNGFEKDLNNKFHIKPNNYALFSTYEEAKNGANYIEYEAEGAEPALWQPWIVCEYDLSG